jgi:hypothetical protein
MKVLDHSLVKPLAMLLAVLVPLGEMLNKDTKTLKQFGIQKILLAHITTIQLPRQPHNQHLVLLQPQAVPLLHNKLLLLRLVVILADHT